MQLQVVSSTGRDTLPLIDPVVVLAGFTGRAAEEVAQHVEELRQQGVAAPATVPEYYRVPSYLLVPPGNWEVWGDDTSGEAEPVLVVRADGRRYLGIGSDHTDRERERLSIPLAKQLGPKVLGEQLWPLEEVEASWDALRLESTADGQPYQSSRLAALLPPAALPWAEWRLPGRDLVVFMGTVATIGGLRRHREFCARLEDSERGRRLELCYRVRPLGRPEI